MGSATSTGQLTAENHSDSTPDVSYTHDRLGRVKTVTDVTGLRTFIYNKENEMALGWEDLNNTFYGATRNIDYYYQTAGTGKIEGRFYGFTYGVFEWSQTYETDSGRIDVITAQDYAYGSYSNTFNYAYDGDSNLVAGFDGGSYDQIRNYDDHRDVLEEVNTKWGTPSRAQYLLNSTSLSWQNQYKHYILDRPDANSLAAKFGSGSDITYTMTYEKDHQLKTWDSSRTGGTDSSYAWDSAGNPTNYDGQGFTPNGLNQIEPTAGYDPDYIYDVDGNLTQDKKRWKTYTYDANNRLIKATYSLSTGYYSEFKYDYMGRRVEKKVVAGPGNSTTTRYVYQGMELIAEIDTEIVYEVVIGGDPLKTFHWGMDKSSTRGGAGGAMGLLMMRIHSGSHTGSYFPAYDLNGNVTGMMNSSGTLVAWYEYDGFGKKVTDGGVSGFEDVNPIQFSTQFFDQDTGLINYGFRYYDPSQGRFLNRDPIGEQGGANLYRFVNNNPIQNVDVWGLGGDEKVYELKPVVIVGKISPFEDLNPSTWDPSDPYYGTGAGFADEIGATIGQASTGGSTEASTVDPTQKNKVYWDDRRCGELRAQLNSIEHSGQNALARIVEVSGEDGLSGVVSFAENSNALTGLTASVLANNAARKVAMNNQTIDSRYGRMTRLTNVRPYNVAAINGVGYGLGGLAIGIDGYQAIDAYNNGDTGGVVSNSASAGLNGTIIAIGSSHPLIAGSAAAGAVTIGIAEQGANAYLDHRNYKWGQEHIARDQHVLNTALQKKAEISQLIADHCPD